MTTLPAILRKTAKRLIRSTPIPVLLKEKILFFLQLGYWPDFDKPESFCEKLHARKLQERDSRLVDLSDKLKVRDYVARKIGPRHLIPLKYSGENLDPDFLSRLGDNIVVKRNDDSGSAVIIRENSWEVAATACRSVNARKEYGKLTNEWWYRSIPAKLLVEERLFDSEQPDSLLEYKFFVFGRAAGMPRIFLEVIRRDKGGCIECGFFDSEMEPIRRSGIDVSYRGCLPLAGGIPAKDFFPEMKSIALKLGEGFNFVRVDLYVVSGNVYFSEMTFNPAEGRFRIQPPEFDFELGRRWELPVLLQSA